MVWRVDACAIISSRRRRERKLTNTVWTVDACAINFRRRRCERELTSMVWRVNHKEIMFVGSMYGGSSRLSNSKSIKVRSHPPMVFYSQMSCRYVSHDWCTACFHGPMHARGKPCIAYIYCLRFTRSISWCIQTYNAKCWTIVIHSDITAKHFCLYYNIMRISHNFVTYLLLRFYRVVAHMCRPNSSPYNMSVQNSNVRYLLKFKIIGDSNLCSL
jgi:hypothetical protein